MANPYLAPTAQGRTADAAPPGQEKNFAKALRLVQNGAFEESERLLRRAVKKDRHNADAFALLGMLRVQTGKYREALVPLNQAVRLDPNNASTYSNLAVALEALERFDKATGAYRKALEIDPNFARAHANLGALLWSRGNASDAIQHLERAVELNADFAEAHAYLSLALHGEARADEAQASASRALALKSDLAKAHWARGLCLQSNGDIEEAKKCYRAALKSDPALAEAYKSLAYASSSILEQPLFEQASEQLRRADASVPDRCHLHYALGKACDNASDYSEAFKHWQSGAKLHRSANKWSVDLARAEFKETTVAFGQDLFVTHGSRPKNGVTPIFIVGMPRSGTTMVEQILASHPDVVAFGETLALGKVVDDFGRWSETDTPYPQGIAKCNITALNAAAERYLDDLRPDLSASHSTDKNLATFKRLGLVACLFPNARIVHCRRHPLDIIVSCFSQEFGHGLEWSYDLSEAADYYELYMAYMEHWHAVLPIEIFDLDYESVVADLETNARDLLRHCGLPWNEACLSFHETRRAVYTVSDTQVRQPIYKTSVGRWRRYEAHLGDLVTRFAENT